MAVESRLIRYGLNVVALTLVIIGMAWVVFRNASSLPDKREAVPLDRMPNNSVVAGRPSPSRKNHADLKPPSIKLTPADVIGNPDCIMKPGAKHGRDLAIIVVPAKNGSRFAVVDHSGVVFEDSLPFTVAPEPALARREDGSVLAVLGGCDDGPAVRGVVVYQDRQIIFENRESTGFGLANDGSSFFVMDPMPGNVTRLVIRNLDLGLEIHHELGTIQPDPEIAAYAEYTVDQSEVIVGTPDVTPVPREHFAEATFIVSHDDL